MRKLLTATILLLVVVLAAPMWAQTTSDVYQVHPFFDGAPAIVQIVNPGVQGTPISSDHGTVCADIYVFDLNQEMLECCACPITANGTLSLLRASLLGNTLTAANPTTGVFKVVAAQASAGTCNPENPIPIPDLRAWGFGPTYDQFAAAPLSAAEQGFLGQACAFVRYLGSGRGRCTCTDVGGAGGV